MPIKDLSLLLQQMQPKLDQKTFYFCVFQDLNSDIISKALGIFREQEGITIILAEDDVPEDVPLSGPQARISLMVESDLTAIGFLVTISNILAKANISINVISGFYHDYLFVPLDLADQAMDCLQRLQTEAFND